MPINEKELLHLLSKAHGTMSLREMMRDLNLHSAERRDLQITLRKLDRTGRIERVGGKNWRVVSRKTQSKVLIGLVQVVSSGNGFVRLDPHSAEAAEGERDVMVFEEDLADALDGDTVAVELTRRTSRGLRGRIVDVLERARTELAGMFQQSDRTRGEVIPRDKSIQRRIEVAMPPKELGISNFDWVMVEITDFTSTDQPLRGKIKERLGASHERGIDVLLLLRDRGIVPEFPPSVEKAASELEMNLDEELKIRHDLRELKTITIDPATAKDFDDALSIEKEGDCWRLWVHIADVSYFVRPNDTIDEEARARATSVYPVDRVVPMLPERLSNDLCSLNPHVDRFTMTAEMIIKPDGTFGKTKFYSSVIHSDHRLTYEEAQAILEDTPEAKKEEFGDCIEDLFMLRDCSRTLRSMRERNGSLDLDIPETEIMFHETGEVEDMRYSERFEAHRLVEHCMLAANEAVAEFLAKKQAPALYRIHEPADPDRIAKLEDVLKALGVRVRLTNRDGDLQHHQLQKAIESIGDRRGGHIIRRMVLRALKRAEYSPDNRGHFGLASKCYCHFTSPIRRYPDLVVHRQLRALERNEPLPYPDDADGREEIAELADHTSTQERVAESAEWDSTQIKATEYIKQFEGDEMNGLISGVQGFGLFIELEHYSVEGLVHIRTMTDDRYDLDDLGISLVGRKSGRKYKLTDEVRVKIVRANPFEGELDLELVGETPAASKGKSRRYAPPRTGKKKSPKKGRGKKR
ncbi:ribonuclease R [bacterium]|nr:ribonuclease R [bacterium]